jgi:hypothetical protein
MNKPRIKATFNRVPTLPSTNETARWYKLAKLSGALYLQANRHAVYVGDTVNEALVQDVLNNRHIDTVITIPAR